MAWEWATKPLVSRGFAVTVGGAQLSGGRFHNRALTSQMRNLEHVISLSPAEQGPDLFTSRPVLSPRSVRLQCPVPLRMSSCVPTCSGAWGWEGCCSCCWSLCPPACSGSIGE